MSKFTTPCFIRKNTPELRKKLKELGYKSLRNIDYIEVHDLDKGTAIITYYGGYYDTVYFIWSIVRDGIIDCGTNEDLFLAIAALRDDSDYMQWFCLAGGKSFTLCRDENNPKHLPRGKRGMDTGDGVLHKASVEELIEHFKE